MKARVINAVWGLVLIAVGIFFLLDNFNVIPELADTTWAVIFAGLSVAFFGTYLASGVKNWGWLFPAFILGGIAAIIFLAISNIDGPFLGTIILWCVAAPFLVAFLINRKENWWALIPMWVLLAVGVIPLVADQVRGEWIAIWVLSATALPFVVTYLANRKANWWALIPAGAILFPVAIIGMTMAGKPELIGSFILFLISIPFFIVYLASTANWWAWIPAGIVASIGVMILFISIGGIFDHPAIASGILFLGWTLTFLFLWLRRGTHRTDWAKWPALGLGIVAAILLTVGETNFIGPIILLLVGGWLILRNFLPKKS